MSWNTKNKKWKARINFGGKRKSLRSFTNEEKAGRAFDKYVVDNNLDRPLNFPVAAEEEDGESSSEDEEEQSAWSAPTTTTLKSMNGRISI